MSYPKTLTVIEIANILRISRIQAYNLVNKGVIPSLRLGRNIRIYEKTFYEWLEKTGGQGDIISLSKPQERRKICQSGIQETSFKKVISGT